MTETKTVKPKTGGKPPAAGKVPAEAKEMAVKTKAAMKPVDAPAKAKAAASGEAHGAKTDKIKVTQLVGTIARKSDQRATLIGLGLNKRHRVRVLENTPSVRGMVYKVRHLVKVEKVS